MSLCYVYHVKGTEDSQRWKRRPWDKPTITPIYTEIVFWDADLNRNSTTDWYYDRPNHDSMIVFAASRATNGCGGAWKRVESSNMSGTPRISLGRPGYWRRLVVPGFHIDLVVTYLGAEHRVPPVPANFVLAEE